MIVFLTKDLFFIPVLQSAGDRHGIVVTAILSLDSPKALAIETKEVTTCVIDLSSTEVSELVPLLERLRSSFPPARVVAFGPHVQIDRLGAAAEAGCDQVLTRGQLNSQIDRLIVNWGAPLQGADC